MGAILSLVIVAVFGISLLVYFHYTDKNELGLQAHGRD